MLCVIVVYVEECVEFEIFVEMGVVGFLGVMILEDLGGLGVNYVIYGLIVCEVEWVDSGYWLMMLV